jgi:NTE family protein
MTEEKSKKNLHDLKTITVEAGEVLFKEGMEPKGIYYIKEGVLAAFVTDPISGKERKVGNLSTGEIVGEMSYLVVSPRCATVRAVSKSLLVEIPEKSFNDTIEKQPPWLRTLIKTLVSRLRNTNSKVFKI